MRTSLTVFPHVMILLGSAVQFKRNIESNLLSANEIFFGEKYEEKIFMFPHVMTLVGS